MMFKAFSCISFTICVSLSLISPLEAGICINTTLQTALCRSPFVLRAKVLSPDSSNGVVAVFHPEGYHKLEIIQLFAFRPGGNSNICVRWPYVDLERLTSAVSGMSGSPDQPLDQDVEYLLTGSFDACTGRLTMDLCDWNKKWNEVSSAEKRKLTSGQCNQSKNVINFP